MTDILAAPTKPLTRKEVLLALRLEPDARDAMESVCCDTNLTEGEREATVRVMVDTIILAHACIDAQSQEGQAFAWCVW